MDDFPEEVAERLGHYVYRLVDDRDVTFYVGKGQRNRAFAHTRCAITGEEGLRYDVIRDLHARSLEPTVIIHRHGLSEDGALIDAYAGAGLANEIRGHDTERGMATVRDIQEQYGAAPAVIDVPAIL